MEKYIFATIMLCFIGVGIWLGKDSRKLNGYQKLILFPYFFKFIGIAWTVISTILVVIVGLNELKLWQVIFYQNINLGLFFVCFSRDKNEDELSNTVRLHSLYHSVISGFTVVILFSFLNFLNGDKDLTYPARQLITIILGVYTFSYSALKRKVFYGK